MVTDIMIALVVLAIVGGAVAYIVKEKKNGTKCIGCSACKNSGGCSSCHK